MNAPSRKAQIVLGIDPGLNTTGYGVLKLSASGLEIIEAGVITSKPRDPLENRLATIFTGMQEVLQSFRPDSVALEELYSHYERPTTAIVMGHARGVLCLAAALEKCPVFHYRATQIKSVLTGNGRAPKSQVQLAIMNLLDLDQVPDPPDVADALAIAVCHTSLSKNESLKQ